MSKFFGEIKKWICCCFFLFIGFLFVIVNNIGDKCLCDVIWDIDFDKGDIGKNCKYINVWW